MEKYLPHSNSYKKKVVASKTHPQNIPFQFTLYPIHIKDNYCRGIKHISKYCLRKEPGYERQTAWWLIVNGKGERFREMQQNTTINKANALLW